MTNCSIPGCDRTHLARGWCGAHYYRWQKHGDPLGGGANLRPGGLTEAESFAWLQPGEPPIGECWDWKRAVAPTGYGQFRIGNVTVYAHVVSHRIYNPDDPVTDEKPFVLHSCDRRICVQPAHLHAGTHTDNMREARERNRVPIGEARHHAKLTEDDVLYIRQSCLTQTVMAEMFGVSQSVISEARSGKTWKHVS